MPTLPYMGLVTPVIKGDRGAWDGKLNAIFTRVDSHDHTAGKGIVIPTAGLGIDEDLPMGGNGFTGVAKVNFTTITAPTTGSKDLFVNAADNELYWRSNAGVNVKLTSGSGLNISLVGGIVGDYAAVGAAVAYDDANKRYTLKTQTNTWARLATGPVRIYEFNTTETVYFEQAVDAALAASYTVTWPAALPGAQTAIQVTAAGVVLFSNTFTGALTATDYRYTTGQTTSVAAMEACEPGAATHTKTAAVSGAQKAWTIVASTNKVVFPLRVPIGCVIKSFAVYLEKNTSNVNTVQARMHSTRVNVLGTETNHGTGAVSSNANAPGFTSLASTAVDADLNVTVTAGFEYYVVFTPGGGVAPAADVLYSCEVTWTRP